MSQGNHGAEAGTAGQHGFEGCDEEVQGRICCAGMSKSIHALNSINGYCYSISFLDSTVRAYRGHDVVKSLDYTYCL